MVVVECGIAPDYFLDEMTDWELDASLKAVERQRRERWEQCRISCFYTVAAFGGKIKKPQDLWEFSWEKKVAKPTPKTEVVAVDKDMVKEMAKQWEEQLRNNI
jgi:hypothetical protein